MGQFKYLGGVRAGNSFAETSFHSVVYTNAMLINYCAVRLYYAAYARLIHMYIIRFFSLRSTYSKTHCNFNHCTALVTVRGSSFFKVEETSISSVSCNAWLEDVGSASNNCTWRSWRRYVTEVCSLLQDLESFWGDGMIYGIPGHAKQVLSSLENSALMTLQRAKPNKCLAHLSSS